MITGSGLFQVDEELLEKQKALTSKEKQGPNGYFFVMPEQGHYLFYLQALFWW